MTDERRYGEDEMAAILEFATRADEQSGSPAPRIGDSVRGLTLAEIQQIGAEVGIDPARIAAGARTLARGAPLAEVRRRLLGFPVSVGGALDLPRPLTDGEWDRLVSEIRAHFNAHGKLDHSGSLRSWRNGNLRVELAPTEDGQRIRMQTRRQQSEMFVGMGGMLAGIGAAVGLGSILNGAWDPDLLVVVAVGGAFVTAGLAPLRAWARRRRQQMEDIAASAVQMANRALPGREGDDAAEDEALPPGRPGP